MSRITVEKNQKLLPTETAETGNIVQYKTVDGEMHLNGRLPIIKCECGTEILLLPDLQAMNQAINTHVNEHIKKGRNAKRDVHTSGDISQLLSQLSLKKISEQNNF